MVISEVPAARPGGEFKPKFQDLRIPADMPGKYGELHDWYLIVLALVVLGVVMNVWPKWGIRFGLLVLLGALLISEQSQAAFIRLVQIIQTGSIAGKVSP